MRKIEPQIIETLVKKLIFEANFILPKKVRQKLTALKKAETTPLAKNALEQINENYLIAEKEQIPLCQDTGAAIFFVEIGHEIILSEPLTATIDRATKAAYEEFYLRKSIVKNPLFDRQNTKTNLPPFVHLEQIKGNKLKITFLPKGGGAENKSALKMLSPAAGEEGVIDFVRDTVQKAGGSACPPFLLGVGIGGTFDTVAILAKKALLRPLGSRNANLQYRALEEKIAQEIEKLQIGTMGLGGKKTLLGVHIEHAPCHIASLPVAVNIQCHSARSATEEI